MNVIYMYMPIHLFQITIDPIVHLYVLRSITHESWTIITKPPRKDLGHTNTKCHNMITSLTTSDLRNTLFGRLKLQETQKMKMTLSHTVWPIIDILQNTKFLLRNLYKIKRTVTIIWLFQLNFPSKRLPPYILNWVGNLSNKKITIKFKYLVIALSQISMRRFYWTVFCHIWGHFEALLGFYSF